MLSTQEPLPVLKGARIPVIFSCVREGGCSYKTPPPFSSLYGYVCTLKLVDVF